MKQRFEHFTLKLTLILFIFVLTQSQAQTTWTLQKCVDYARTNNLSLQQSKLTTETAKIKIEQSSASMFPSLNGNASHSYNFGRTIDLFTNTFATNRVLSDNFSLTGSVNVFNGFQLRNNLKQSHLDFMSSQLDVQKLENDLSMNVVSAYLQILYADENLAIAQKQSEITLKQLENTKNLVEAGSIPRGNLFEIQSQIANDELTIVNSQNAVDMAYLGLKQLLDLDSVKDFKIEKPKIDIPAENVLNTNPDEVYLTAITKLPEVRSAYLKYESSMTGLALATGQRYPRLTISGSIGTGYSDARERIKDYQLGPPNIIGYLPTGDSVYSSVPSYTVNYEKTPFSDQLKDNVNKSFGLFLTVPIFNGWSTKSSISRAKISVENSRLNQEIVKNSIRKSVQQAYADALAAFRKYEATQKAKAAADEAFKNAEQRFKAGNLPAFDFLTSKNNLAKTESGLIQAKYDYIFKLKILDFYQGKSLTF